MNEYQDISYHIMILNYKTLHTLQKQWGYVIDNLLNERNALYILNLEVSYGVFIMIILETIKCAIPWDHWYMYKEIKNDNFKD